MLTKKTFIANSICFLRYFGRKIVLHILYTGKKDNKNLCNNNTYTTYIVTLSLAKFIKYRPRLGIAIFVPVL